MPFFQVGGKLILFIHVPRTGGTTVERHLRTAGPLFFFGSSSFMRVSAQHLHGTELEKLFPSGLFDYAFMIVRHPVERMLSQYAFENARGNNRMNLKFPMWLR